MVFATATGLGAGLFPQTLFHSLVWHPSQGIFTEINAHKCECSSLWEDLGMLFVGSASAPQTQTNQT